MHRTLLPFLVLAPLAGAQIDDRSAADFSTAIAENLHAPVHELVLIALPSPQRPERLTIEVSRQGVPHLFDLHARSVRAAGFRVRTIGRAGTVVVDAPPPGTYEGVLAGEPGSLVVAGLSPDGIDAWVRTADGESWRVTPLTRATTRAPAGVHVVFDERGAELPYSACGATPDAGYGPAIAPPHAGTPAQQIEDCMHEAEIAYDCDFQYYQQKANSVAQVVSTVEAYTNLVNAFYARDVQIRHRITEIIVRTSPFYMPDSGGNLLDLFRNEWNTTQAGVPRDMAHLMTGKPGGLIEFGGLAYVAVVCNKAWAYGWSMDSPNIVGHELGHNWGAGHCHDLAPCNAMCGACFLFPPNTKNIVTAYRDSIGCLDDVGPFSKPVPPYAHPDFAEETKDGFASAGAIAIDVLGNDHDGNCQPISIQDFDATSDRGTPIVLSPGTGPDGRDELLIAPTGGPPVGTDSFTYTVGDTSGLATVGQVDFVVPRRELEGYWRMNEASGTTAGDATGHGHTGNFVGDPSVTGGPFGAALQFDGIDDAISVPAQHLRGDRVTLSAWIRRDGPQADWSGIVMCREGVTRAGLHFGVDDELRYTWNNDSATWGWNSGLVPPDGTWVFVALVVRPDRAVIHMHDGVTYNRVSNDHGHVLQPFDGEVRFAHDPADALRHFAGGMGFVRIYDRVLTASQIDELVTIGGPSEAPAPRDGSSAVTPELSWVGGRQASSHEVYFGSDYYAVRDADTGSPEFQGVAPDPSFTPGSLTPGDTYFWRVDSPLGPITLPGEVWQFRVPRANHWRLDELSGDTAVDSSGNKDGKYFGAPGLGESGATAQTGTSVRFDGDDDRVRLANLKLRRNEATITGWVRRSGSQNPFAGIVFSRAGATVAGLHVGTANELRYTWNDSATSSGWDSGLVLPNDQWVFVALVVEPTRATLYLGDGGPLASATHLELHAPEEFDGTTTIARDSTGSNRRFDGWIDDVRFYDGALSPDAIDVLYVDSQ